MKEIEEIRDKEQIIVTLALIQQALEVLTERVENHHKALFGNGDPERSIVWVMKKLSNNIEKLEKRMEECHSQDISVIQSLKDELCTLKETDSNLTWKQWFKKITLKWLPIFVIIIFIAVIFKEPLVKILELLLKLIGN